MFDRCQQVGRRRPDRKDHVWARWGKGGWKCVLCGAVTRTKEPPPYPTPGDFVPDLFEELTDAERAQCPPLVGAS
jgi:hypothetical protein